MAVKKPKIITVVGARPQFIKCAALSKHIRKNFNEIIVHTGQHYAADLSEQFFNELGIPEPSYHLDCSRSGGVLQIADIMIKLQQVVEKENPVAMIVFGDTNSTAAASVVAAKNHIKLAHVEAGMREFNKQIPEETNKLITSVLADFHFCPTPQAVHWLSEMGIINHVYHCGDVMVDLIEENKASISDNISVFELYQVQPGQYVFATCHRAANTDDKNNLLQVLKGLGKIPMKTILPLHPRTSDAIKRFGLQEMLMKEHLKIVEPMGYIDTQTLIKNSYCVITDSGGVTKEAYYHRVPGILTDTQTEWVETIKEGWNVQAGPSASSILSAFQNLKRPFSRGDSLGDGHAAKKIADLLFMLITAQ